MPNNEILEITLSIWNTKKNALRDFECNSYEPEPSRNFQNFQIYEYLLTPNCTIRSCKFCILGSLNKTTNCMRSRNFSFTVCSTALKTHSRVSQLQLQLYSTDNTLGFWYYQQS